MAARHIAFVLTSFARGGMEMRLTDVVNGLDKTRWNPHIYAFYDRQTLPDKVERFRLHTPVSSGNRDVTVPIKLAREFRHEKTVIVWTLAQGLSAGWGRLGALMAGVPIRIISIHDNYPLAPLTRILNPFTDAIVALTEYSASLFRNQGVPENKIHVLYNGIDTEKYAPGPDRRAEFYEIPPERPVILNVGRLSYEKGRDVMLQAAAPLLQSENPPLVVFAGDGAERDPLTHLTQEMGMTEHVRFLGIRDDVPELLNSADVVVMSSRDVPFGESCPNIVLEGMAAGLPVIGTRVGGTAELIVDGETGFVIPPGNPAALAEKLKLLLPDPDLRRKLGQAGRARVKAHFTIEHMVQGREDLFNLLLEKKKQDGAYPRPVEH